MSWLSLQGEVTLFISNLLPNYISNYYKKPVTLIADNITSENFIGGGRIYRLKQDFHLLEIELWSAICGY